LIGTVEKALALREGERGRGEERRSRERLVSKEEKKEGSGGKMLGARYPFSPPAESEGEKKGGKGPLFPIRPRTREKKKEKKKKKEKERKDALLARCAGSWRRRKVNIAKKKRGGKKGKEYPPAPSDQPRGKGKEKKRGRPPRRTSPILTIALYAAAIQKRKKEKNVITPTARKRKTEEKIQGSANRIPRRERRGEALPDIREGNRKKKKRRKGDSRSPYLTFVCPARLRTGKKERRKGGRVSRLLSGKGEERGGKRKLNGFASFAVLFLGEKGEEKGALFLGRRTRWKVMRKKEKGKKRGIRSDIFLCFPPKAFRPPGKKKERGREGEKVTGWNTSLNTPRKSAEKRERRKGEGDIVGRSSLVYANGWRGGGGKKGEEKRIEQI